MNTGSGGKVTKQYDLAGKLVELTAKASGGGQQVRRTYDYDVTIAGSTVKGGLVAKMTDYGTSATALSTTTYGYGENDQLTSLSKINGTGGSNIRSEAYTYDPAGNRTSRVVTLGAGAPATTSYLYNAANELCWQAPGTPSSPCATTPSGGTGYTYDAAGNQLTGGAATFTWDAKNRLKTVATATLTHLSPTNNELTGAGGDSYQNTLLGVNRVTASGTLATLVREPGGQEVVSQTVSGAKVWFVTDNFGSTIALLNSGGTVQRTYDYDTDGNLATSGTGQTTPILYAGGHYVGYGLIHFGARYYQPATGRWTQPDPLDQPGDLGQQNRYLYVGNNPINAIDPSGLSIITDVGKRLLPGAGCYYGIKDLAGQPRDRERNRVDFVLTVGSCVTAAPDGRGILRRIF